MHDRMPILGCCCCCCNVACDVTMRMTRNDINCAAAAALISEFGCIINNLGSNCSQNFFRHLVQIENESLKCSTGQNQSSKKLYDHKWLTQGESIDSWTLKLNASSIHRVLSILVPCEMLLCQISNKHNNEKKI